MRSLLVMFLGMVMIVLAVVTGWSMASRRGKTADTTARAPASLPVPGEHTVAPFRLVGRDGGEFDSGDLDGKVWIASFFFTRCESACVTLNNTIADLIAEMPENGVQFVSITVDPKRDTPERLAEYAQHYDVDAHRRWDFLTGQMSDIKNVAKDSFSVSVDLVTHSDRMILVDRDGTVVDTYHAALPADVGRLKKKVAELCEEPS